MPSRRLTVAILAFWLGTTGWMFYQDVWPQLQPHAPPPFTIDLVDEAKLHKQAQIRWNLFLEGDVPVQSSLPPRIAASFSLFGSGSFPTVGQAAVTLACLWYEPQMPGQLIAKTWVDYREKPDDSFSFNMEITPGLSRQGRLPLGPIMLNTLRSQYRVNRAGQLREMSAEFKFDAVLFIKWPDIEASLAGEVRDGEFFSRYRFQLPKTNPLADAPEPISKDLPPVPVASGGSVMMPLHPVNRIKGLRPGQSWRMPVINPLADALRAASSQWLGFDSKVQFLNARVLPKTQLLPNYPEPIPCLVIEYDDEETKPRTWVQDQTGLVLRQEATLSAIQRRLILQRETIVREP